ncbi:Hypothetical predicted protein, partial [Marmota monax]
GPRPRCCPDAGGTGTLRAASPAATHRISRLIEWLKINGKRSINLSSSIMEAGLTDGEPDRTSQTVTNLNF